jgi:predicted pyridoxine 5'-phosphate oxidase superfamily flavin-nucleotide-binding protein
MSEPINDVAALEACIGKPPGSVQMKVIDHLDEGGLRWIAASPLLFAGFGDGTDVAITLGGGEPGFVRANDGTRVTLPSAFLDEPALAQAGQGFGALFLAPGIGETLRVNGRVVAVNDKAIEIAVEECYVHCAKALIRSDFWNAPPQSKAIGDASDFLAASRFLVLATVDAHGRADVSPKGDPQGAMIHLSEDAAWFADRPGNRRADSFRNILTQPRIAIAALVPGTARIALLSGTARITTDEQARAAFAVQGKIPLLATRVEDLRIRMRDSASLIRAQLWPVAARADGIDPAAMFVAHLKLSKGRGLSARLVRMALSVPGLMKKALAHDYKRNLY